MLTTGSSMLQAIDPSRSPTASVIGCAQGLATNDPPTASKVTSAGGQPPKLCLNIKATLMLQY